jgi:hypothetical protein
VLLPGRIEDRFLRRVEALPGSARLWLVVAAAEPTGDLALVWRATAQLGLSTAASASAAQDGLVEIGARVHLHAGEFGAAASLVEETAAITEATRNDLPPYSALALAGWQGRTAEAGPLINAAVNGLAVRGEAWAWAWSGTPARCSGTDSVTTGTR